MTRRQCQGAIFGQFCTHALGRGGRAADLQAVAKGIVEAAIDNVAGKDHGIVTSHAARQQRGMGGETIVGIQYHGCAGARRPRGRGEGEREVATGCAAAQLDPARFGQVVEGRT